MAANLKVSGFNMWTEFKAFLLKENVLALAIAVVVGGALGKVVTAVVEDLIMPIVGFLTPQGAWRETVIGGGRLQFPVGDFASHLLNFVIVAFVVWRISKAFIKPAPESPNMPCPYCRMEIDKAATRCGHCTSQLADVKAPPGVTIGGGELARR